MKCKREIMGLAALMIVLFHFYIPFGNSPVEFYLYRIAYIGVDLFFFVSAYSLAARNGTGDFEFGKFILNRVTSIYLPFVVFTVIAAIYKKWTVASFFKTITGIEFFKRGGGSFLWYFIGIMIIYLVFPLFLYFKKRFGLFGLVLSLIVWAVLSSILQFGFGYTNAFIVINRLPVFFIGLYYDELIRVRIKRNRIFEILAIVLFLVVGVVLTYRFATMIRLNKPFADMYYIVSIPLVLGIVMLIDFLVDLFASKYKSIVLKFVGGITLELYSLQMIFGYDIEMKLLKVVPFNQLACFATVLILVAMAFLYNTVYGMGYKAIVKTVKKEDTK